MRLGDGQRCSDAHGKDGQPRHGMAGQQDVGGCAADAGYEQGVRQGGGEDQEEAAGGKGGLAARRHPPDPAEDGQEKEVEEVQGAHGPGLKVEAVAHVEGHGEPRGGALHGWDEALGLVETGRSVFERKIEGTVKSSVNGSLARCASKGKHCSDVQRCLTSR